MKLTIRSFKKEDAEETANLIISNLVKVNSKDYSQRVINNLREVYTPENLIEMTEEKDLYIAESNGEIMGTAGLKGNTVYTVFVKPKYHNSGVGRKLMEYIEKLASKRGWETLKVPASTTAWKFYKRLGYKKVKEVMTEDCGKNIIMKKKLAKKKGIL